MANEKETVGGTAGDLMDQQTAIARKSLETHNGCRPSQNPPMNWDEVNIVNGGFKK